MGNARSRPGPRDQARVTEIDESLLLLTVPVESTLDPRVANELTRAERAVVGLTLDGLSNGAIARLRRCSPRTVANQLAAAYKKLGVVGRRELRACFGR